VIKENNLKETKEREKWKRGCEDGFFQTDAGEVIYECME